MDLRLVDEPRRELRDGAVAELAFAQRVGRGLAFGDVYRHADHARELAGGGVGDGPVARFDPAQLAVGAPDLRLEFHRFARRIAVRARQALLLPVVADEKALPAAPPVFFFAAAVHALRTECPLELVPALRIHHVFVHRALRQIRDGAIARVVQREDALVRLAAVDVARVRDDAADGGIREPVHRDALEPAPGAVAVTEAVLEAVEFRLRLCCMQQDAEALAHRLDVVRMQELRGIAPDEVLHAVAEIAHHGLVGVRERALRVLHRDDLERVFGERTQARIRDGGDVCLDGDVR
jgi:hypothetical protein